MFSRLVCPDVLRTRLAALLDVDDIRVLRCIDKAWQHVCDTTLLDVKGAFIDVHGYMTIREIRYSQDVLGRIRPKLVVSSSGITTERIHRVRTQIAKFGTYNDVYWACARIPLGIRDCFISTQPIGNWFIFCALNGNLGTLQAIHKRHDLISITLPSTAWPLIGMALIAACRTRHFAIVQWLVEVYERSKETFTERQVFRIEATAQKESLRRGSYQVAQYMLERYTLDGNHNVRWMDDEDRMYHIHRACSTHPCIDYIRWAAEWSLIDCYDHDEVNKLVILCVRYRQFEIASYLVDECFL
jgi:hypothetical protein